MKKNNTSGWKVYFARKITPLSTTPKKHPVHAHKKDIRISQPATPVHFIDDPKNRHFFINLGQMVTSRNSMKNVKAYMDIASVLSALAGLKNGHVWTWNYVQCIVSGTMKPSKKFIQAVDLYSQKYNPRQKRWFYFSYRKTVAAIYNKNIMAEVIRAIMSELHYKEVTYSRYMEIKKLATMRR